MTITVKNSPVSTLGELYGVDVNVLVNGTCNHAEAVKELVEVLTGGGYLQPDTEEVTALVCKCGNVEYLESDEEFFND